MARPLRIPRFRGGSEALLPKRMADLVPAEPAPRDASSRCSLAVARLGKTALTTAAPPGGPAPAVEAVQAVAAFAEGRATQAPLTSVRRRRWREMAGRVMVRAGRPPFHTEVGARRSRGTREGTMAVSATSEAAASERLIPEMRATLESDHHDAEAAAGASMARCVVARRTLHHRPTWAVADASSPLGVTRNLGAA